MARTANAAALTTSHLDKLTALVTPKVSEVRADPNTSIPELKDWLGLSDALDALKTKASEPARPRAPRTPVATNDAAAAAKKDKK